MKKLAAILLTSILCLSASGHVLADGTTVLTTTVPPATYTLNIPADQEISFGRTSTVIGNVTVTDANGFAEGKDLQVTVTYDAFSSESVSTKIPYKIRLLSVVTTPGTSSILQSGGNLIFRGKSNGSASENAAMGTSHAVGTIYIDITSEDWGKALAGEYSSTITFTSEVIASES